jgi:Protein of unknown function (DUF5672)
MECANQNISGPYDSASDDSRSRKKLVAVVTPVYRLPLTTQEEISFKHLRHYLGKFDKYIVAPKSLPVSWPDFQTRYFKDVCFSNISEYSKLLAAKQFYQAFADYEYILIHQLDCLVFSNDLEYWCAKRWDYVGAPWFKNHESSSTGGFWAVGNGGLSLRNVSNALAVLESKALYDEPSERGRKTRYFQRSPRLRAMACKTKTFLHRQGYRNTIHWHLKELNKRPDFHEDRFWALDAKRFMPQFRIPTPQEAVAFSFECAPQYCFKANSERLPFGCHAWTKWGPDFWEPYLLR